MLYTADISNSGELLTADYSLPSDFDATQVTDQTDTDPGYTMFSFEGEKVCDPRQAVCVLIESLAALHAFNELCAVNGVIQIASSQTPRRDSMLRLGFYMLDDMGTWAFTDFASLENGIVKVIQEMRAILSKKS